MRPIYIWQHSTWAEFTWDDSCLITLLSEVRHLEGKIQGMMSGLGFDVQSKASLDVMTEDVLRSSEIEGGDIELGPRALFYSTAFGHRYGRTSGT